MKRILYGAGAVGISAIEKYGKENIAYFYDINKNINDVQGIPVIHELSELKKMQDEYLVTITTDNNSIYAISKILNEHSIKASWIYMENNIIHVSGRYPSIKYTYEKGRKTNERTVAMLNDMFEIYGHDCYFNELDFWIYTGDYSHDAYIIKKLLGTEFIFAYNTLYSEKNVIPIPDYMCYMADIYGWNVSHEEIPYSSFEKCIEVGKKKWIDDRAFWAGTINTAEVRKMLYHLYLENDDKLCVNAAVRFGNGKVEFISGKAVPMIEFAKYKYLICVQGYGWSDRLKHLLALGRVVLLVEYPYKEYWTDELEPMVHYVPVKSDLSNLLAQINYLNTNPDIYQKIVDNAIEFVKKHFYKSEILLSMNQIILNNIR